MNQHRSQSDDLRAEQDNRVIILSGVRGDTRRYRSMHPYEQLKIAGVDCELSHITDPSLPTRIVRSSVALFHRLTHDSYVERLLQTLRQAGGLAIMDVDDLVFDPGAFRWIDSPDFQDPIRAALYREDMRRNLIALKACQAAITSTQFLANQVQALGVPVWVHRNAFSLEMLALSEAAYRARKPEREKIVIGYASGTPTHDRDFEVAKPALMRVMARHPQIGLRLIGPLNPGRGWGQLKSRVDHQELVPWRDLPEILACFDINLAPLVTDNPFGQSKSEIKYVEAALVRVPTVASPTRAYQFAIRPGENGFLAADDRGWEGALTHLVEDKSLREAVGRKAYDDALARYHPAVRSMELVDTLNRIHEHQTGGALWPSRQPRRGGRPASVPADLPVHGWIPREAENRPTLTHMALYTLRHRGGRTLAKRLWVYLRRLLAPVFPYNKPGGSNA
jgi:glycosyltransferase involved in cell wall biosynthesis